jgi:hypothetical protein
MENQEINEYRTRLLNQLEATADAFCAACKAVPDPFAPTEEDGWNTHQLAAHARDVQVHVYGQRVRRCVEEDAPVFPNFDNAVWNAEHYRADEPLDAVLDEFMGDVRQIVPWLRKLPAAAWSRPSRHAVYGEFAMQHWVERMLAHIKEHLATVQKVK